MWLHFHIAFLLRESLISCHDPSYPWFVFVCLSVLSTCVDNVHFIGHSTMYVGSFGPHGIIPKCDMLTMLLNFIPMENTFNVHFLAI